MECIFDNVYVLYINQEELDSVRFKLSKKDFRVEYFLGVDGNSLHEEFMGQSNIKTIGAYGHLHSMMDIMRDAMDKKYRKILILEADVYFSYNFEEEVRKIKKNWKLLYLGASQHRWYHGKHGVVDGYYNAYETFGTFAVGIDSSLFGEYLEILKRGEKPSDTCLLSLQVKYWGECFVCSPNLVICDVTRSLTSGERNQVEYMNKFRWMGRYAVENVYKFEVESVGVYMINVSLNSCRGMGYLKVGDVMFRLPDDKFKNVVSTRVGGRMINSEYYILYFYFDELGVELYVNNLFVRKISLMKVSNLQKIKNTLKKYNDNHHLSLMKYIKK